MRKLIISLAASAVITAGAVAGLQASSQASTDGNRLQATFTASPVSVTPNLGMVELILSGTGTVEGFLAILPTGASLNRWKITVKVVFAYVHLVLDRDRLSCEHRRP